MYYVYILRSLKDGKHYTGYTENLERRFREHNSGKTRSTKWRRPFEIIHFEEYSTKEEAEKREKYLKSGKGREEIKLILSRNKDNVDAVPHPPEVGRSGRDAIENTV